MESKQRLRPWLEAQINNGEIPGLYWMNPDKTKFRIPWKHGGKQDWHPESGQIFKEWARHTGRFREGIDEPDYVKWKTRLRCAFNKAPDIEEVKDESQLEGPDPYRVYLLKPRKTDGKKTEQESKVNTNSIPNRDACFQTSAPLPACLDNIAIMSTESFPSDLKDVKTEEMFNLGGAHMMSINNISMDNDIVMLSDNFKGFKIGDKKATTSEADASMILKIVYDRREVMDKKVDAPHGCRLYYDTFTSSIPVLNLPDWMNPLVYQDKGVDCICLPPCHDLMETPKQETLWQKVLEQGLQDGICLKTHNDDIYALRFCACQIYYVSLCGTSCAVKPLKRQMNDLSDDSSALTKIFDYHNEFLPALERFRAGTGPEPSPTVYLVFAWDLSESQIHSIQGIHVAVTSVKAQAALQTPEFSDKQFISSDEKCASIILACEAMIKAEQPDSSFHVQDWNKPVTQEPYSFSENRFCEDHILDEYFLNAPTPSNNDPGLNQFDDSTIDFSTLYELGLGPVGSAVNEYCNVEDLPF